MNTCILSQLSVLKMEGEKTTEFIYKLSASNLEEDFSYLFFLNENGRYLADCFFIKSIACFISKNLILNRLENYLKKMDIRNRYKFSKTDEKICYSTIDGEYKDPRMSGYISIIKNVVESKFNSADFYKKLRIQNEIAEFDDFVENKSIITNYGKISKFISKTKGCYPGQELMARFNSIIAKKTVTKTNILDSKELRILLELDQQYLIYKNI